jgi:hypothetical protein
VNFPVIAANRRRVGARRLGGAGAAQNRRINQASQVMQGSVDQYDEEPRSKSMSENPQNTQVKMSRC